MSVTAVIEAIVKSVIILVFLLTAFAYMTLYERKVLGRVQVRYGPNRVGPFGLLQPLADGIKLAFKQAITPRGVDKPLYLLAPAISMVAAVVTFAVIPVGPTYNIFGYPVNFWLSDFNVALLYVLAMSSLGVYGIVLAGYSSNNKYSLLGGLRSAAQLISYELALGLSLVAVLLLTGSLSLNDILNHQGGDWWGFWPRWHIFVAPLSFIIYIISAIAETNRAPFDLVEAEQELVGGYHTEYTGLRFALFFMAEYINMVTVSALAATIFFGGWYGPIVGGPWWLLLKMAIILTIYVLLRATLPRLRYDQLMRLGWRVLLPLALLNIVLTAIGVALWGS
ncbi:MAG TPA: NADH-quinone oxidoreductase subunit NuoH [Thermomicrobiales bacterium]|nr:NADH-quinone oxidoreductase subunit NuoH [Thermomicrobiales bacterium]